MKTIVVISDIQVPFHHDRATPKTGARYCRPCHNERIRLRYQEGRSA